MKVLMFGWEFPPQISGGLGTACHGLTQSLIAENVEVLFVVPTFFGGEEIKSGALISASEIIVPATGEKTNSDKPKKLKNKEGFQLAIQSKNFIAQVGATNISTLTEIKVSSGLDPYFQAITEGNYDRSKIPSSSIQQWNYAFSKKTIR